MNNINSTFNKDPASEIMCKKVFDFFNSLLKIPYVQQYAFSEMYNCIYNLYIRDPEMTLLLFYKLFAELINSCPSDFEKHVLFKDIFMYVMRKESAIGNNVPINIFIKWKALICKETN